MEMSEKRVGIPPINATSVTAIITLPLCCKSARGNKKDSPFPVALIWAGHNAYLTTAPMSKVIGADTSQRINVTCANHGSTVPCWCTWYPV